jgi:hypothetical protein
MAEPDMVGTTVVVTGGTSIYLASSPEVAGVSGQYFIKCQPRTPKKWAQDPEAARRWWDISQALVAAPAAAG